MEQTNTNHVYAAWQKLDRKEKRPGPGAKKGVDPSICIICKIIFILYLTIYKLYKIIKLFKQYQLKSFNNKQFHVLNLAKQT